MIKPAGERNPEWADPTPWDHFRRPTSEHWKRTCPFLPADTPDPGFELDEITYDELIEAA